MPDRLDAPSTNPPQGRPDVDTLWVEPYPDAELANLPDTAAGPDARYELAQSVRLAFLIAIQQLPPRQRAALLLADVLGWSAIEVAAVLDASVNSILQRARAKLAGLDVDARPVPLADEQQRSLLDRYVRAWESLDLERFIALLKEDAICAMPPWREWYRGSGSIADFFASVWPAYRGFRLVPIGANLQPAFALYSLGAEGRWNAHCLHLLSLGAPLPIKTRHSSTVPPAKDTDFLIVDFDLVNHGSKSAGNGVSPVRTFVRVTSTNFAIFSCVIRASGRVQHPNSRECHSKDAHGARSVNEMALL
jgi:RNA polymerase sigma-70 factor (TIGR02960 family)